MAQMTEGPCGGIRLTPPLIVISKGCKKRAHPHGGRMGTLHRLSGLRGARESARSVHSTCP